MGATLNTVLLTKEPVNVSCYTVYTVMPGLVLLNSNMALVDRAYSWAAQINPSAL